MDKKKIAILLVLVIGCLFWFYHKDEKSSDLSDEYIEKINDLEEDNEQLKKQLEEKSTSEKINQEEGNTEKSEDIVNSEIESLVCDFLKAQYEYNKISERYENLKPYVTTDMLGMFGGTEASESSVSVTSKVDAITIYQLSEKEGVARVVNVYQVQDNTPITNEMLIELEFEQDSSGNYLVSNQAVYNIQGTE